MSLTPTTTFKEMCSPVIRGCPTRGIVPLNLTGVSGNSNWSVFWYTGKDGRIIHTGIRWEGEEVGSMKGCESVELKIQPQGMHDLQESSFPLNLLEKGMVPPTTDREFAGPDFDLVTVPVTHTRYFILTFEITMPLTVHPATGVPTVGKVYTDINSSQFPNDVRLVFPHSLELWTTVKTLSASTSYFKDLFASGFAEAKPRGKESYAERTKAVVVDKHFEDSDDESDELSVSARGGEAVKDGAPRAPFRQIDIDAVAYTTYRAFLCWLQTSHINFAPLSSSFRLVDDPVKARNAAIDKMVAKNPSLPRPASPKSMYRLAHFLDIPDLMQLALRSIKIQLTVENIAFEVYGDLAGTFKEVREVEVDYAAKHWAEVKDGAAMVVVERLMEEGAKHLFPVVTFALARRLSS